MKDSRKYILWILVFLSLGGLLVSGSLFYGKREKVRRVEREREGLTLVCPRLAHCADAFLLYDDEKAVLIDAGEKGDADLILKMLEERGITSLEALILTHYDKDHIGGAPRILRQIPIKTCYLTCGSEDSEEFLALTEALKETDTRQLVVTETERFSIRDTDFTIWPPLTATFEKNQDNNLSLIIGVKVPGGKALLFTGDAQKERIDQFLEKQYDGTLYTWLKVPHHGRDKKTVKMLLDRFTPEDAVICSSQDEAVEEKVMDLLADAGVRVWLTRQETAEFLFSEETEPEGGTAEGKAEAGPENGTLEGKAEAGPETEPAEGKAEAGPKTEAAKGNPVAGSETESTVSPPVFSAQSGFYEKPFALSITAAAGTKIYYTLDCSEPTDQSTLYQEPLQISDPTPEPNVHSVRTDFEPYLPNASNGYTSQVAEGWFTRNILPGNVDKCRVVRAMAVDREGHCSDVVTASYFIGYGNRPGYEGISVLSLVSDPKNLFDPDIGIMVNGREYQKVWESGAIDGISSSHLIRKYCNTYKGRGRDWERKVHLDYFGEENRELVFTQEAGLRLHGNQSRVAEDQKSFNLYARRAYDGNSVFKVPFYGNGLLQDRVTLMRGSDVRNYYLSDKMNHRIMDSQQYRLTQVFLDGEYWGIYAIQERYHSDEYMRTHFNLGKEDYILAKGTFTGFEVMNGDPDATKTSFRKVRDFARSHDLSREAYYQELCEMIDIQSFIDNYAAKLYTGDQDWSWFKNQYLLFFDHKWHWLAFDMDYGAGAHKSAMPDTNTFTSPRLVKTYSLENDPLFPYLMKNDDFRRQFVNTFLDLGNGVFRGDMIRQETTKLADRYQGAGLLMDQRYPTADYMEGKNLPGYVSTYARSWDGIASYFEQRFPYASSYLAAYFGLEGSPCRVTLVNDHPEGGTIRINTITPSLDENHSFTGTYYSDYPVTLEAETEEGWTFKGWELVEGDGALSDGGTGETELTFTEDIKVRAVFENNE